MATAGHLYDSIGLGYSGSRRPDPRIAAQIIAALGPPSTVLNVGAGAGSYEPNDRPVVAVEPSAAMVRQRPAGAAPVVRAVAEALPLADGSFHAATIILSLHHWRDAAAGLAEVRRVARGPVVVLTFDFAVHLRQWLTTDYLPEMAALDTDMPSPSAIGEALGGGTVEVVPVPHDCTDGFCHAWWRRPAAYLDPTVRNAISTFARLPDQIVDRAVAHLARDLDDGTWERRHADLIDRDEIDAGYRLVISPGGRTEAHPLA